MKKIILIFAASVTLFQSCTNNTKTNGEMKKPDNNSTEVDGEKSENGINEGDNSSRKSGDAITLNFQNMQDAFKGETTASAKYAAFSIKAEAEGYHQIALLFKAASTSENIHANNHKAVLEEAGQSIPVIKPEFKVNTTIENLKEAITGEGYEISTMYPEFITNANKVGNQLSLVSLNYAYKTEKKHKVLYEKALAALENKTDSSLPLVYYVCSTCGNTYDTAAPKRCGISMTSAEKFIKITSLQS